MPIDVIGLVLLVTFVGSLQLMLDLGKEHGWFEDLDHRRAGCRRRSSASSPSSIWELTEKHPIVDLRVFRHRGFTMSVDCAQSSPSDRCSPPTC